MLIINIAWDSISYRLEAASRDRNDKCSRARAAFDRQHDALRSVPYLFATRHF